VENAFSRSCLKAYICRVRIVAITEVHGRTDEPGWLFVHEVLESFPRGQCREPHSPSSEHRGMEKLGGWLYHASGVLRWEQ
jgi:hypothetical protein